ncbi:hypothetical protein B0H14DRAFT_3464116 [Mycena olivaceomarginata]|nr:hypothetical protein B0H14DRAFT_3464116 [Mycena olivaceomarginata]
MGAVRTTFAMVAASIVRRKQLILRGLPDPYAVKHNGPTTPVHRDDDWDLQIRILQALEQASAHQDLSKSLLRLTYLLQQCLQNRNSHSAIELLMTQPALLDNLRKAHMGNYGVILSLLGCLDHGREKRALFQDYILSLQMTESMIYLALKA